MRTFLAVYRAGSLTGAAPQLGLSQPTVTAQIRTLEAQLGQQLFQRLPRGVVPTSVADELARQVAVHIDALAAIAERGLVSRDPLAKPVHLGGPAELTAACVLPSLADLVNRGLKLRVTLGLADDLLAGLVSGRFDIVISAIRPRGRALTAVPLTDEEFVLVGAPAWAARIDRSVLPSDPAGALRGVPLISYAEDLPIIRRYWRLVFGTRPTGSAAVVVPDLRGVLASTAAGAGVTVLPRYLCAGELASGRLVPLLEPEIPPINTLFLATRTGTATLPHIAAVHSRLLKQASLW
ncbi:LysR family transcriptional regulator [Streptosporangium sp. NPDC000396]|uniref:LysR family transcriptional regulator n=1 Tax=Streptosporangium sp. NPDC000396 TaxID=3366185 RepID=UPI00368ACDFD